MKFIDLSYPILDVITTFPLDPDVSIVREKNIETDNSMLHSFKEELL